MYVASDWKVYMHSLSSEIARKGEGKQEIKSRSQPKSLFDTIDPFRRIESSYPPY